MNRSTKAISRIVQGNNGKWFIFDQRTIGPFDTKQEAKDYRSTLTTFAKENPLASPTTELVVGGVASVVLIGLGVTMVYQALNPAGASTSDTLQNTAALAALAGVV